jgi:hypothetical protein
MKMEPNKIYTIEEEPNTLQALIDDLDEFLADTFAAGRLIHKVNDTAFDLRKTFIAIKKSNGNNTKDSYLVTICSHAYNGTNHPLGRLNLCPACRTGSKGNPAYMAETANIAKMAEKLSQELFNEFLWSPIGSKNRNWPCEEQERHHVETHPSDVVFFYDNPYALSRTYVNCDLKSYSSQSIKASAISAAMESLAQTLNCAEKSSTFQKAFTHEKVTADICGLLFIYNHDGEYDKNFTLLLSEMKPKLNEIPRKSKIFILGPEEIFWLDNVRYDIVQMRGSGLLPSKHECKFYYPNLRRKPNVQPDNAVAATLEMLTSPWVLLSHALPGKQGHKGFVIYYRRKGNTVREFLYLIDYLMYINAFGNDTHVRIRTLSSDKDAPVFFRQAADEYVEKSDNSPEIKARLAAVDFAQVPQVKSVFSDIGIGME